MTVRYKIPSKMLKDYDIVLPDGSEIPLDQLAEGFIDLSDSAGSPHDIHHWTGSPMEKCELWYSMMGRLYSAISGRMSKGS